MVISIKDPETDRLARLVARAAGETITVAVATALRERLQRLQGNPRGPDLAAELDEIAQRCARLPVLDGRSPEEIVGYDEDGLPGSW